MTVEERGLALLRPARRFDEEVIAETHFIVDDVFRRGDVAVREHALRLDGSEPALISVAAGAREARATLSAKDLDALSLAFGNIEKYHAGSVPGNDIRHISPGLRCSRVWRAIENVGLYIPGGSAPLFSTLLMLAIPARVAGVKKLTVATPPQPGGGLSPVIALAAEMCGIDEILLIGGAQAIAAMARGGAYVERADKICGPGNAYVSEAKTYVSSLPNGPAIDMPAGPSELLVIADEYADVRLVAADLLSQAEHDPLAQVVLVATSEQIADFVEFEVKNQLEGLPRRAITKAALEHARTIIAGSVSEAIEIANAYAPEHLALHLDDAAAAADKVSRAGAVFVGKWAAESFGDYAAGPSHVLPTDGAARAWSGVSVLTFLRSMSVQEITAEGAVELAGAAAQLARLEGLEAHARAAKLRSRAYGGATK